MTQAKVPLVLLPGMMCDGRLFGAVLQGLGERAVLLGAITGHDSTAALAAEVLRLAPPRFALGGLSMGGIVAMEMAALAPERVAGLCLMDTNPRAERPEIAARRGPQMEAVRAGRLRAIMRDEMKPNYLAQTPLRASILELCMEMALDLGPEVFLRQSRALMTRPDRREALRCMGGPSLVLCGKADALCPVERHKEMHALLPAARLVVIEAAAHLPVLEAPNEARAALRDWLAAVDAVEAA
jgi:pimeloyl-ACP methyl ester carboxylesterase